MARTSSRVYLHTGNPSGAMPRSVRASAPNATSKRKIVKKCSWCGGVAAGTSSPARCRRCRKLDRTIEAAKKYVAQHALRPIGKSIEADSIEESDQRRMAQTARLKLDAIRTDFKSRAVSANASNKKKIPTKGKKQHSPKIERLRAEEARVLSSISAIKPQDLLNSPRRAVRLNNLRIHHENLKRSISKLDKSV